MLRSSPFFARGAFLPPLKVEFPYLVSVPLVLQLPELRVRVRLREVVLTFSFGFSAFPRF